MKYIASVSFGKDSLAMLLELIRRRLPLDVVVYYNNGMDFNAIYNIREQIKPLLQEKEIQFVELKPDEPFLFSMFDRTVKSRSGGFHNGYGWCGGLCRWGTSMKRESIRRYKNSLGDDVIDYVGIAADENNRFEKEKSTGKQMPLVEWGMTEADCLSYCHQIGYRWMEQLPDGTQIELYDILDRVSCWCCRNKNIHELRNMWKYLPEYWGRLKELQEKNPDPFKGKAGSIHDLEQRFLLEEQFQLSGEKINTRNFYEILKKKVDKQ